MKTSTRRGLFGVVTDPQSFINIFYLLLSFPLGIAYFVFLVTGISLGFGLLIIWVGVPILGVVLAGSWVLCELERMLAIGLLKEDIPPTARGNLAGRAEAGVQSLSSGERFFISMWRRLKGYLSDRLTWTGMLYLFLKFPLGIASFVIAVTLISVTAALLAAPIAYLFGDFDARIGGWDIDTLWEAGLLTLVGIPMVFVSLYLMNQAAFASGRLARVMLGRLH
ncbi:MAG: sensor domain-containing protein [Chloroflexi bacterium]|nr:sensor domain-containing protein [Chloroflexota bacterium]